MRWARLLHAPERVEVIEIDGSGRKARIRRNGFEQEVSLDQLILEEEEGEGPSQAPAAELAASQEGVSVRLQVVAGKPEVTLSLQQGVSGPAYVALYLRAGASPHWHPLWQEVFSPALRRLINLSTAAHPPPWTLRLLVLPLLTEVREHLPYLQTYETNLRPLFFARTGTFPIEWAPCAPIRVSSVPPIPGPPPSAPAEALDFPRSPEIDLHIEKLAPHLSSASGEMIFHYQKETLERYLDWAFRERLPKVRVIHGKGELRLRDYLLKFCQARGWRVQLLLVPPFSGGATEVSF